jgi:uncharacterized protein YndB with AHSA1/START domain
MNPANPAPATRGVERELEVNAPVEAVWKALAEAEEIARWFAPAARVTPGAGGEITWIWKDIAEWTSKIEIWEPNRHLRAVYNWSPAPEKSPPQQLAMDFYLEARGGKTLLRLVHSGFGTGADWEGEYDGVSRGWSSELCSLRHYLENHRGATRAVAWAKRDIAVSWEEGWKRMTGPQGLALEPAADGLRAGSRYTATAATGDKLSGLVLLNGPPKDFVGTAAAFNNGLFRLSLEKVAGPPYVWVWLSAYRVPQAQVDAFARRWQNLLLTLFPEEAEGQSAEEVK